MPLTENLVQIWLPELSLNPPVGFRRSAKRRTSTITLMKHGDSLSYTHTHRHDLHPNVALVFLKVSDVSQQSNRWRDVKRLLHFFISWWLGNISFNGCFDKLQYYRSLVQRSYLAEGVLIIDLSRPVSNISLKHVKRIQISSFILTHISNSRSFTSPSKPILR